MDRGARVDQADRRVLMRTLAWAEEIGPHHELHGVEIIGDLQSQLPASSRAPEATGYDRKKLS
jgi:hypothetical protein